MDGFNQDGLHNVLEILTRTERNQKISFKNLTITLIGNRLTSIH